MKGETSEREHVNQINAKWITCLSVQWQYDDKAWRV